MSSKVSEKIRLSKSVLSAKEANAVRRVMLEDGYLGMGKEVQCFESELEEFIGGGVNVTCVSSGTAALQLGVMAAVKPGEEVLVQSLTFVASFQAIAAAGAVPVACEIDPSTITIDLKDAERRLTAKTKAIMPVHYASGVGDLKGIYAFAKKYGLRVIEDAAHAFGTIYNGKRIGSFGDIACFSFDGIKNITSGEGGAVVTRDSAVTRFVQDARLLGVKKDTEKRFTGQRSWEFDVTHLGYRYHMSNIFAALGRTQLARFAEFKKKRQVRAKEYVKALSGIAGIALLKNDYDKIVPHIFPVRVLGGERDALRAHLLEQNIETGIHYYPNHLLTLFGRSRVALPVTEKIYSELLTLPLHPDLTARQQEKIIASVRGFLAADKK